MSAGWLVVVLAAALLHATWNMLLKGGRDRVAFTLIMLATSVTLYFPAFIALYGTAAVAAASWKWIAASGAIHTAYFYLLALAYGHSDLSLVYPVARGSGAALAVIGGTILLKERPNVPGWAGIVALALGTGILLLHQAAGRHAVNAGDARGAPRHGSSSPALCMALATGLTIGGYSVVDKVGVGMTHPFVYLYLAKAFCTFLFALVLLSQERRWRATSRDSGVGLGQRIRSEWRANGKHAIAAGFFTPATYVLALFAMTACNVSYVAPLRETSVFFSFLLAKTVLRETTTPGRWAGMLLVLAGVVLLGVAR